MLQTLFPIFEMLFGFWPVLLLYSISRRKTMLQDMLLAWSGWAVIRLFLFFNPEPLLSGFSIIPEPWSTLLFFLTGAILFALSFGIKYWKQNRLRSKILGINSVDTLLDISPGEFEDMVVGLYQAFGHQAKRTGKSGDHGVDVVVKAKNGEQWIIQCKRWRKPVGEAVIREFYGALHHEKAHQGAIIAVGGFSNLAIEWAKGKPIVLYSGEDFLKAWRRVEKQQGKK